MGKGLLFFCCSCFILVLTIVNLSIGPIISGKASSLLDNQGNWGTLNCKGEKDSWDALDKSGQYSSDALKYGPEYQYNTCQRAKGMHDMEYTAFIFDIVIGFICGLLGLLHLFDLKKDFVSNTGLIGLICGVIGFVLTLVYVIFNGLVYTTVYVDNWISNPPVYKRDGDLAFAEKDGTNYKCLYFDKVENSNAIYAKISDLGKKQYNYDKDGIKDLTKQTSARCTDDSSNTYIDMCATQEKLTSDDIPTGTFGDCKMLYINMNQLVVGSSTISFENKDLSDRFLTSLILSLFVCLASIGLALFGFLLFRTPGDF